MTKTKTPSIPVLYILTKLELGGAQKVCLSLIDELQKQGHQSMLISGNQGVLVKQAQRLTNTFLLSSFKREVGLKTIFHECKAFFTMIHIMKKLKTQHPNLMVHTHSTKAGLLGRWAALFAGIKKRIHTVHGYGFHNYQGRLVWLCIYISELVTSLITSHFVCVSDHDRQIGIKLFPRFAKKSSVIRAAVDWNAFYIPAKKLHTTTSYIIGTTSCFKPQKNLFDMLNAFKLTHQTLTKQNITPHLEIIGDGTQRKAIEQWIITNDLTHFITLHGWKNDIVNVIREWDIFSLSSLWEGLPCSVIEARLQKIPVVAYNVGGIREVIAHGKNGFLVKPGDWQQLAKHYITLLENPTQLHTMQEYPDQLNNFSHQAMGKQHIILYKKQFSQ